MISVKCLPRDLWVSEGRGGSVVPSLSSKFVVPSEAESVLPQINLRHSVSLSLIVETWEQLVCKIPQG